MRKKDEAIDGGSEWSAPAGGRVTPLDVQQKEFRVTRVGSGYRMREVDEFLDQITDTLTALVAENDRLRTSGEGRRGTGGRDRSVDHAEPVGSRRGGCLPPAGEGVPPGSRRTRPGARRRAAIDDPRRSERARGAGHADGTRGPGGTDRGTESRHRSRSRSWRPSLLSSTSPLPRPMRSSSRRSPRRAPSRTTPTRTRSRAWSPTSRSASRSRNRTSAGAVGSVRREGGRFAPGAVLGRRVGAAVRSLS